MAKHADTINLSVGDVFVVGAGGVKYAARLQEGHSPTCSRSAAAPGPSQPVCLGVKLPHRPSPGHVNAPDSWERSETIRNKNAQRTWSVLRNGHPAMTSNYVAV